MEILNDCSDVDEIKFQEDGSWCPMRPKKEAMKVSSQPCTKIESMCRMAAESKEAVRLVQHSLSLLFCPLELRFRLSLLTLFFNHLLHM